jgi:hypothetical protein
MSSMPSNAIVTPVMTMPSEQLSVKLLVGFNWMKYSEAATPGQLKKNLPATTGGYFLAAPHKKATVPHPIEKRYNFPD